MMRSRDGWEVLADKGPGEEREILIKRVVKRLKKRIGREFGEISVYDNFPLL